MIGNTQNTLKTDIDRSDDLPCFEEVTTATMPIVLTKLELDRLPPDLRSQFRNGYDGLDYLQFASIELSLGKISIFRHQGSPATGLQIGVDPDFLDIPALVYETLTRLKVTMADIEWIHLEYKEAIEQLFV